MTRGAVKPGMTIDCSLVSRRETLRLSELWANGCFNVTHPNGDLPNITLPS